MKFRIDATIKTCKETYENRLLIEDFDLNTRMTGQAALSQVWIPPLVDWAIINGASTTNDKVADLGVY